MNERRNGAPFPSKLCIKIKTVAREFSIYHLTLSRVIKKLQSGQEATVDNEHLRLVNEHYYKIMFAARLIPRVAKIVWI